MIDIFNMPNDEDIMKSLIVTQSKIDNVNYNTIMCSVSGGADSDLMVDICVKCDEYGKVNYVFFDTGLEYQATKDHLKYLEDKYGIKIEIVKCIKPIPITCREYGQPFLSKQVSEYIQRLQRHNFKWEDKSVDELLLEYPKCKVAIRWWCNDWGDKSKFNISYNKWLKEFMVANPPQFKISNMCCKYAKKDVAHNYKGDNDINLSMVGVRKAEGGARSSAYKNCFTEGDIVDEYRPLFYYKDSTKLAYEDFYGITHSKCYTEYGLKRTGCAGCPYGREFEFELYVIEKYEPKLFKAVNNIFSDSYEYTRRYREFVKEMNNS